MHKLYNLTNPQNGIWLTEQYYKNTSIGNISGTIIIEDKVDFEKLEKALNIYVQKNDSIRTHIVSLDSSVIKQYINNYFPFKIHILDIKKEELENISNQIAQKPFFLIDSNLFTFTMFRFPDNTGGLQVTFHHLIADAWTMSLFINETISIYEKLLNNEEIDTSLNPSYEKYITEESEYMQSNKYKNDEEYWNEIFNSEPEIAKLKLYNNNIQNTVAKRKCYTLNKSLYTNILDFCKSNKISVFTFLMSIYSVYLAKINNMENVTIGTPILNRANYSQKNTSGMFVSTMPFNTVINKDITFSNYCLTVSQRQMNMFRHQKYPYLNLLDNIKKSYQHSGNLYDICISYQNARDAHSSSKVNYHTNWLFNGYISDSLDLHFYDMDNNDTLDIFYDYQVEKFDENEIESIHNRILNIIDEVLNNNNILIKNIEIITPEEKKMILSFNKTKTDYPNDKNIIDLFNEQILKNPNSTAVNFEGKSFTYKELNDKANSLSHYLLEKNLNKQDVIALFMDKSFEAIISILAVIKIGAIYLPIDIDYPEERISYILKDSNAKCILTSNKFNKNLNYNIPTYIVDLNKEEIYKNKYDNILSDVSQNDIAYIMYTSGSTGKPKGVLITQKGIIRLVKNTNYITFSNGDKILQTGSIVFDACTFEIWGAFLNGLELYLLKKSNLLNPMFFEEYIIQNNITTLFLTTALFNKFCESNPTMFRKLKYLLTGGEAVSKKHMKIAKEKNPNLNIVHVYGPTENTTFSTYYNVKNNFDVIPIGYPISNTTCYIVSKLGGLQPINTPGELLVGGDGVSVGYLNRDDLNKEKFINLDFENNKIYRTGDLVSLLPDGSINFIGRIDNQVKIRGFRIELSEIDSKILTYPNIKESITIVNTVDDEKIICSYISCQKNIDINDLKNYLKDILPHYMVPSYISIMDKLPLNINGKIERKKLPSIDFASNKKEIKQPENELQKEILGYVKQISKKENISIDDDFINDLCMDSLNTMELATKLYKYNIDIQEIINHSTIEKLSTKIKNDENIDLYNNNYVDVNVTNKYVDFDLTNVLLTGTTGFLGTHILKELIYNNSTKNIYCLIREKNNVQPELRLKKLINKFFDQETAKIASNKIKVINGNFIYENLNLSENDYQNLLSKISCVIHCGAKVKHFGKYDDFYNANVLATKYIIDFCLKSSASLAYISTLSVGGLCKKNNICVINENKINVNQEFKNQVYMYSKYLAECEILKSINKNNLNAKIFRMGNIMPRLSDGVFQKNYKDNAFICKIHTLIKNNLITDSLKNYSFDLSPVDLCAQSIICLLNIKNSQTIYHIYNNNKLTLEQFFKLSDIKLNTISNQGFIDSILKLNDVYDTHLLNELNFSDYIETPVENNITTEILNNNGFNWNIIDSDYINKIIKIQEKI